MNLVILNITFTLTLCVPQISQRAINYKQKRVSLAELNYSKLASQRAKRPMAKWSHNRIHNLYRLNFECEEKENRAVMKTKDKRAGFGFPVYSTRQLSVCMTVVPSAHLQLVSLNMYAPFRICVLLFLRTGARKFPK